MNKKLPIINGSGLAVKLSSFLSRYFNSSQFYFKRLKTLVLVLLVSGFAQQLKAADYYWVGGTGNWSEFNTHWATTSGGGTFHTQIPQSVDNVHFDANSFSAGGQIVTLDVAGVCTDFDWTGATNSPTFTGSNTLTVYGSFTLISGMTWSLSNGLLFSATTTGETITLAGKSLTATTFNGVGGEWTFQDAFSASSISHTNGTLNTNGFTVTSTNTFSSSGGSTRTLTTGSSVFNVGYDWTVNSAGLTFNNSSTTDINYTYASAGTLTFTGGGYTYRDVTVSDPDPEFLIMDGGNTFDDVTLAGAFTSGAANTFDDVSIGGNGTITNSNTFDTLTFSAGKTYTLSGTQTITGLLNATGTCTSFITITGAATISSASTIVIDYINLTNISATGGGSFTANNTVASGTNTGWTINALTGQNLYWIGGTGNWNDGNHWSLSSGGSAYGCPPHSLDNVFFDANSFSSGGQTVTLNVAGACQNMDWTGATNSPTFTGSQYLTIYGSFTLISAMTWSHSSNIYFSATSTGKTITLGGKALSYTTFNGVGGGWTFQDTWSSSSITHFNGTLNTNGQTVTVNSYFQSTGGATRTLTTLSSTFNVAWGWTIASAGLTFNNSSTTDINFTYTSAGNLDFTGGGYTYRDITVADPDPTLRILDGSNTFDDVTVAGAAELQGANTYDDVSIGGNGSITNSNTFDTLTFSAGKTYTLSGTQTITGLLNATGICTSFITMTGAATISSASTIVIDYINLTNITATGGGSFTANNTVASGTNTGWTINALTGQNLYWIGGTGNWNDGNHWSLSSGGSAYGCPPHSLDNVFFDANSFSSGGQTVTLNVAGACQNMDWTGATNSPTFTGSQYLTIYGSFTLISAMTWSHSSNIYFSATSTGKTITLAGKSLTATTFNGVGGGWTFQDSYSGSSLYHTNGTLNTNGQTVTLSAIFSSNGSTRTLTTGSSTFNTGYSWSVSSSGLTFNNSSTTDINFNYIAGGNMTFTGGGYTYHNVTFPYANQNGMIQDGGNTFNDVSFTGTFTMLGTNTYHDVTASKGGYIYASNSYNNLTFTAGFTYNISGTQTIGGDFNAIGTGGFPIYIYGPATFSKASGAVCADYVRIQDLTGTGGATFYARSSSQDLGGNTGWTFLPSITPPTASIAAAPDTVICEGTSVTFTASFTAPASISQTYVWFLNGDTVQGESALNTYTSDSLNDGDTILVHFRSHYDCDAPLLVNTNTIIMQVKPAPVATASSNSPVSLGAALSLTGSVTGGIGPHAYSWTGPNSYSNATQSPTVSNYATGVMAGNYIFTVTDTNGCSSDDTTTVVINSDAGTLNFDGSNDYVALPNIAGSMSGNNITLECWFKTSGPVGDYRTLVGKWRTGGSPGEASYGLSWDNTDGLRLMVQSTTNHLVKATTGLTYSDGLWHHVAGTFDGTTARIYVDGVLIDTSVDMAFGSLDLGNSMTEYIGSDDAGVTQAQTDRFFNGNIEEVRIWNRTLCLGEILHSMNNEINPAIQTDLKAYYRFNHGTVGASNAGITTLADSSGNGFNGTLNNFALTGTSSNWDTAYISGTATAFTGPTANIADGDTIYICMAGSDTLNATTGAGYTYQWQENGVDIGGATNSFYVVTDTGSYTVVVTENGCSNTSASTLILYFVQPVPSFTINNDSQCVNGNSFVYTNTSTIGSGSMTYTWDFGDGNTSPNISPSHSYAAAGTYVVKLIATSNNGCKDSTYDTVYVLHKPVPSYTINNDSQCVNGNSFVYTNTSTIGSGSMTYAWDFGDGNTSASTSPSHSYTAAGTYIVKLVATSNWGCMDSTYDTVYVLHKPVPSFTINNDSQCVNGNSFVYTNTSTIGSGSMTYAWDFGDGNTSASTSPSHSYATAGTYVVKLVATSNWGCLDSTYDTVYVLHKPVPAFTINNDSQCVNGNSFVYTNTSTIGSGSMTYAWDFGDGNTSTSTSPSHSYATAGTYVVKLVATSNWGCIDSTYDTVYVLHKPVPAFTINNDSQCVNTDLYVFTNTSTIGSGSMTYAWDFGDGNTSVSTSPSHSYATAGTYMVKLVSTSNWGCMDSTYDTVYVLHKPVPSFTINNDSQCVNGNSFVYTNTSTIGSGSMTYAWDFGDGNTSVSTSPSHSYATAGTYVVKLVATSNWGCLDSAYDTVYVLHKPVPAFTINNDSQCLNTNVFVFTNTSTIGSGSMTYAWDFGDGNTSTNTSPSHTYATEGTYTVKLVATSNWGCIDSVSSLIVVHPKPIPNFTVNDSTQCYNGHSFVFTNTSTIASGTMSYGWVFGDGGPVSGDTNPTYFYVLNFNTYHVYPVNLQVTSDYGCYQAIIKQVTIYPSPVVNFSINDSTQCLNPNNNFVFTNGSSISSGTITHSWTFGDGDTSTALNPSNTYAAAGTYTVELITTSNYGCQDSVSHSVTVYPMPAPGFTINNAAQCLNPTNLFVLTNTTTSATPIASYLWNFKDGNTSALTNSTHTYFISGSFAISLTATDTNACVDSVLHTVTVNHKPNPAFTVNDSTQCKSGHSFGFTNLSTIISGSMTYAWDFGDGTTSNAVHPTKVYGLPGTYYVKLVASSNNGCKDSVTHTVIVYPQPHVVFSTLGSNCAKDVTFANSTTISSGSIAGYSWNFGDATTSTVTNPTHTYTTNGINTYNVKLLALSDMGCLDSVTLPITTTSSVVASFVSNYSSLCLNGNAFLFTNTSNYFHPAYITSSFWDFGDGTTSAATFPPVKSYATTGIYNVKLVVYANNGCNDTIVNQVVVVKPVIAFGLASGSCSNTVTFTNSTTVLGGGSATYLWKFGDGATSTSATPTHTYASAGIYTVKLIATTVGLGCVDSLTQSVSVGLPPTAAFSSSISCNSLVSFSNTSSNAASYLWSFGDGDTSTLMLPTHGYTSAGTYAVKLVATSTNGCKDSVTHNVTTGAFSNPPVAIASIDPAWCNQIFIDVSSHPATSSFRYLSFYPDNSPQYTTGLYTPPMSMGFTPSAPFASGGVYTYKVVAYSSSNSCTDTATLTYTFTSTPVAAFSTVSNACTNAITFINSSTVNYGALTYSWNFGDGSPASTDVNPTHSYAITGTYSVSLTVTSASGCTSSIVLNVNAVAGNNNPVPGFSYALASGSCTNKYQFTNTTSGGAVSYLWYFGDGSISTFVNPSHAYAYAGTYTVKLIAYTSAGCSDSTTQTVTVTSGQYGPAASFTSSSAGMCLTGNSFSFYNSSSYMGGSWIPYYYWDFGDGTFSYNTFVYNKTYASAGSYLVKLIAIAADGCSDTAYMTISVGGPAVAFSVSGSSCSSTVLFSNTTTAAGNPPMTYMWYFGDGGTSTNANPFHIYSSNGSYSVKLIATTNAGCSDSLTQNVVVGNNVVAGFTYSTACDNSIAFTNTSLNGSTYAWDFGDAGTSVSQHPTHSYAGSGMYNVKLVVTSVYGCKDSVTQLVSAMTQTPAPDGNAYYNLLGCNSVSLHANTSVNTDSVSWFAYTPGNLLAMSVNKISKNDSVGLAPVALYGPGTYTIKMVAYKNGNTCTDTTVFTINFSGMPTASFSTSTNACTNAINFNNTSVNGNTYFWSFGDAGTSTQQSPSHSYLSAGSYLVTLTVTSSGGCVAVTSQNVTASAALPGPSAGFSYTIGSTACVTNRVRFTNSSSGASSYIWIFGDGKGATTTNAANTYALAGTYTVKLVAITSCGTDTASATITIGSNAAGVVAVPGVNAAVQCITNNNYIYPNYSYHTNPVKWIPYYSWNLGDGSPLNSNNHVFNYQYSLPGNYTITLIATDIDGCKDTATFAVSVLATPCFSGMMLPTGRGDKDLAEGGGLDKPATGSNELNRADNNVVLYPNPNQGQFKLALKEFKAAEVTIKVMDMLGRILLVKDMELRGSGELEINHQSLADGKYQVLISDSRSGDILARKAFSVVK